MSILINEIESLKEHLSQYEVESLLTCTIKTDTDLREASKYFGAVLMQQFGKDRYFYFKIEVKKGIVIIIKSN